MLWKMMKSEVQQKEMTYQAQQMSRLLMGWGVGMAHCHLRPGGVGTRIIALLQTLKPLTRKNGIRGWMS